MKTLFTFILLLIAASAQAETGKLTISVQKNAKEVAKLIEDCQIVIKGKITQEQKDMLVNGQRSCLTRKYQVISL